MRKIIALVYCTFVCSTSRAKMPNLQTPSKELSKAPDPKNVFISLLFSANPLGSSRLFDATNTQRSRHARMDDVDDDDYVWFDGSRNLDGVEAPDEFEDPRWAALEKPIMTPAMALQQKMAKRRESFWNRKESGPERSSSSIRRGPGNFGDRPNTVGQDTIDGRPVDLEELYRFDVTADAARAANREMEDALTDDSKDMIRDFSGWFPDDNHFEDMIPDEDNPPQMPRGPRRGGPGMPPSQPPGGPGMPPSQPQDPPFTYK